MKFLLDTVNLFTIAPWLDNFKPRAGIKAQVIELQNKRTHAITEMLCVFVGNRGRYVFVDRSVDEDGFNRSPEIEFSDSACSKGIMLRAVMGSLGDTMPMEGVPFKDYRPAFQGLRPGAQPTSAFVLVYGNSEVDCDPTVNVLWQSTERNDTSVMLVEIRTEAVIRTAGGSWSLKVENGYVQFKEHHETVHEEPQDVAANTIGGDNTPAFLRRGATNTDGASGEQQTNGDRGRRRRRNDGRTVVHMGAGSIDVIAGDGVDPATVQVVTSALGIAPEVAVTETGAPAELAA
jgi:hypothetical protein